MTLKVSSFLLNFALDCDHGRYRANEFFGYCYFIHIENFTAKEYWHDKILKISGSTPVTFNSIYKTHMEQYWIGSIGSVEPVQQDYTFIEKCKTYLYTPVTGKCKIGLF